MKLRVGGLDGIRGIAVILVFIEHFVRGGYGLGPLGVRLFFVLSGFLIVGILYKQREAIEANKTSVWHELKKFWGRRVRRIFPVYYLTLSFLLLYFLIQSVDVNTDGLIWYFLFSANLYIQNVSLAWGGFSHLWSISVEQHFYLLASPILLLLSTKYHKKVLIFLATIALLTLIFDLVNRVNPIVIEVSSIINFSFMAMGGLIAIARQQVNEDKLIIAAVLLLVTYVVLYNHKQLIVFYPSTMVLGAYVVSLVGCSCLIWYVISAQTSRLVAFLEYWPLKKLGEISYGFYVYHYFSPRVPDWVEWYYLNRLWFVIQFVLTVIVAWASWHFIERKLLRS